MAHLRSAPPRPGRRAAQRPSPSYHRIRTTPLHGLAPGLATHRGTEAAGPARRTAAHAGRIRIPRVAR
ncbi:hypothetical protein [Streptomyces coffeae]|uniref:Uncharacterized protein n=1 Tax=Streptomyces coffeae TaxID=621382 RepID=A0ABS1NB25_9ACTN|nr:hypothetical protein [Streptomyces coffeae]MBL1097263.1 hypothetical protein [Streptomyces coffeae]